MRLGTVQLAQGTKAVRVDGDRATEIGPFADVGELLRANAAGAGGLDQAAVAAGPVHQLSSVRLVSPIINPAKIICVGQNYRRHIEEMGKQAPKYPTLFHKWPSALVAHNEPLELPAESDQVDWEGELVVVIGQTIRRANPAQAAAAIVGYTIMCDTSMRDWQNRTAQVLQGKNWDRSTPMGPVVATPDELPADPVLITKLNGQEMQCSPVSDMLFGPVELVQYISTIVTLVPGDVIATGTPSGVGHGRTPPVYLRPGDTLEVSVDGIGSLVNPVREEP
ncbi:MAG: fumarylacetoacetate hydrolase family protein [Micrococcales bacterium]|nr:fumarylacetoacetate hydrolase family protein [Micrococcales bacterium]